MLKFLSILIPSVLLLITVKRGWGEEALAGVAILGLAAACVSLVSVVIIDLYYFIWFAH